MSALPEWRVDGRVCLTMDGEWVSRSASIRMLVAQANLAAEAVELLRGYTHSEWPPHGAIEALLAKAEKLKS